MQKGIYHICPVDDFEKHLLIATKVGEKLVKGVWQDAIYCDCNCSARTDYTAKGVFIIHNPYDDYRTKEILGYGT